MYLSLAAGHAQILLAAGALEEHIVLTLTAAILGGQLLPLLSGEVLEIEIVLHLTLGQISGKGPEKGHNHALPPKE